jgi:EmrB/QacA subfamily drug resistance transporter
MEGFNTTVLFTALPQMSHSLGVAPTQLSLAVSSYIVSLAVFIPISGWIADRFGARRVYCSALLAFIIGSALCGLSTNLPMLVAMRVLQGFGGAMMTPVGRLILARSFPKDQLIIAMNYMAIPGQMGLLLGPAIGGFVTTYLSWHWIFFLNVPVGLLAIGLTLRLIADIQVPRPPRFDILGFVIMGFGLAFTQLALEYVGRPLVSIPTQLALFGVAAAILLLYLHHARRAPHPVLDLALFGIRTFSVSVGAGSLARIGLTSIGFILPLLFQMGFGLDAFHSGLLVCVLAIGSILMRFGVPTLLRSWGLPRVLATNAVVLGLMIIGFCSFRASTPVWFLVAYIFAFGFLRSVQFSALNALSYADLHAEIMGRGTSLSSVAQRLAQSAGIGIAATLLAIASAGTGKVTVADFTPVFIAIGIIELTSLFGILRLAPSDGMGLTGHRMRGA